MATFFACIKNNPGWCVLRSMSERAFREIGWVTRCQPWHKFRVTPDAKLKSSPNVSKSCPKCKQSSLTWKILLFIAIYHAFGLLLNFQISPNLVTLHKFNLQRCNSTTFIKNDQELKRLDQANLASRRFGFPYLRLTNSFALKPKFRNLRWTKLRISPKKSVQASAGILKMCFRQYSNLGIA